jgi:signal transduction histidine kinase
MLSAFTKAVKNRRNEIRLAIVFLSLIIIPGGLLAYFSWRAIESEKLLSQERLRESYSQFARLAGREIDHELERVEERWADAIKKIVKKNVPDLKARDLKALPEKEPLIAACFLLTAPGVVVYPPGLNLQEESSLPETWEKETYLREYEFFRKLVARGEELEYRTYDLNGAIETYREIVSRVSVPQLRAMAENYIGRALVKKGDWDAALATFQHLLADYPETRDLNKMYLRFVAQYQIAVILETLGRDQEAIEALLRLNRDLFERSDLINTLQYSYFLGLIQTLSPRLLTSPQLTGPAHYEAQFRALAEQNKKRLSQKYFLQLLDKELSELVIERKQHREKFRYISDKTDKEPYLLACRSLPDATGLYVGGLLGLQIDLANLRGRLFPKILRNLEFSQRVTLAILSEKNDYVIGTASPGHSPIAVQSLAAPFNFWQVGVYLSENKGESQRVKFITTLGVWLISLLLLSILIGTYIFIRNARQATRLSQMKSTFVSSVSHELRTPLASIKMLSELMEMQLGGQSAASPESFRARAQQYLRVIHRECDRLSRLIENVLDFSKIERGVKQYNFEYEDLAVVLHTAIESFRPHAEANGFSLEVEVAENLPELRMDADAISQVMLNLLSNAVKYSDERKEIRVRAYRHHQHVAIEVSDQGIGIPAAEIPKIFDGFYRVDQRLGSQKQGGVGLGLTLARHIVRAHGGEIVVRSEEGRGSTFTFSLPIPVEEITHVNDTSLKNGEAKPVQIEMESMS